MALAIVAAANALHGGRSGIVRLSHTTLSAKKVLFSVKGGIASNKTDTVAQSPSFDLKTAIQNWLLELSITFISVAAMYFSFFPTIWDAAPLFVAPIALILSILALEGPILNQCKIAKRKRPAQYALASIVIFIVMHCVKNVVKITSDHFSNRDTELLTSFMYTALIVMSIVSIVASEKSSSSTPATFPQEIIRPR